MNYRLLENPDDSCSTHLIEGDGTFNVTGVDNFMKEVKLEKYGLSYAIVSIMGPQSSGKSTLLNHLFRTNFREMDAYRGRSETTKGIWMARCVGIEPCTIVMDLEGTNERERGEDDTAFEKQSALFAFAVSDIVLINMWCHDIGREHAANRPLLKTVFEAMMRLFTPRKRTLMFVIRDKTKTPLECLESILRGDIQKIWDSVTKPKELKDTPLSDFFCVEVVALSSFEEKEEQFKEQVANLRRRFHNSIASGELAGHRRSRQHFYNSIASGELVGDRRSVAPASGFAFIAQQIWKIIKDNKELDLPAHKVMVAVVRCEEIANKKFSSFVNDEEWCELEVDVNTRLVVGFGQKLNSLLDTCLSEYDAEVTYFSESVRSSKRKQLEDKLLQLVEPAYLSMLGHLRSGTLVIFKEVFGDELSKGKGFALAARECTEIVLSRFDEGCLDASITQANWDASKVRDELKRDIEAHIEALRSTKLSQLTSLYEKKLNEALSGPVEALFDDAGDGTWPAIRKLFLRETEAVLSGFSSGLSGYELDEVSNENMILRLRDHARGVVEGKARVEAERVLIKMKDRFSTLFSHDSDSVPRVWTGNEDIRAITMTARSSSLKLLSVVAAIRLDEDTDSIGKTLSLALLERSSGAANQSTTSADPLSLALVSSTWDEVPAGKTLITPVQCKSLWRQFLAGTEYAIYQAFAAQEANKRNNNWTPLAWAMVAMMHTMNMASQNYGPTDQQ